MFAHVARAPLVVAWLAVVLLSGCATTPGPVEMGDAHTERLLVEGVEFELHYRSIDQKVARDVASALATAVPRMERWGRFTHPVTVRIHPTHAALEEAVRRHNYPWLRAWARFDSIDLQSPRTWGMMGGTNAQLVELLTHELTHCLMYQRIGTPTTWMRKGVPLWFREGMASYASAQGYRRATDEEIWRYLNLHPERDPVAEADVLYQTQSDIVYGTAHRAFEFLVQRYGDESVRRMMDVMGTGAGFDTAFEQVIGLREDVFAREFIRYVRWEGWRGRTELTRPTRAL